MSKLTSGFVRWLVMVQKELLELARSYKLLWVPLVFILLGIIQPVSTHLMPLLLEKAGSLPTGTVIEIPSSKGVEVLAATLQQFGTLGVLVLVLVGMGTISGERNSGAASLILVKPISTWSFISSKWTALVSLSWFSLLVGYAAAWYYTELLIGAVPFARFGSSVVIYGLWLTFVMSVTVLFSTLLRSPAGAAFSTLGAAVVLSLLAGIFPKQLGWSPGAISGYAYQSAVAILPIDSQFGFALVSTILLVLLAITASVWQLRRATAVD